MFLASSICFLYSTAVSKPMSNIRNFAGRSSNRIAFLLPSSLTTKSLGTVILPPNSFSRLFACSVSSSYSPTSLSRKDIFGSPRSWPLASKKMFATTPVVRTLSTTLFLSIFLMISRVSKTLMPPSIAMLGLSLLCKAFSSISISFSMTLPARLGNTSVKPVSDGCARCAAANASFIK